MRKRKEPMNTLAKKIILASNCEMHHSESAQGKSKKSAKLRNKKEAEY